MAPMNVTDISIEDLAKIFIDYVSLSSVDTLRKSYMNDVVDDDVNEHPIGKFRLIHIFNDATGEYLTFTVSFYMDSNTYKMNIFNYEKKALILECSYDKNKSSWISNILYTNINLSSVICTDMVVKLKSIL